MELKDIKYIVTIAQERSFTRAAEKLYVSQPALSLCVQRLERQLNTKLFIRDKNLLVLTPAGKMLVEEGRSIIGMTDELTQRIYDAVNFGNGVIKVGFSQFYGRYYSPELFRLFQARYPGVHIELTEDFSSQLESCILRGDIDLAIIPLPILSDSVAYEPLFQEKIYLAAPKRLAADLCPGSFGPAPAIDLRLVKDQPFIMLKKFQKIRQLADRLCQECSFTPNVIFETQDMNTINNFVALNMGVGFVSDIIEKTSVSRENVSYFQLRSEGAVRTFAIAYKKGAALSATCKKFIALAREHFASH